MGEKSEARGSPEHPEEPEVSKALDHVARALRGLRFGQVTLVVQDGVAIQVERIERTRLSRPANKHTS